MGRARCTSWELLAGEHGQADQPSKTSPAEKGARRLAENEFEAMGKDMWCIAQVMPIFARMEDVPISMPKHPIPRRPLFFAKPSASADRQCCASHPRPSLDSWALRLEYRRKPSSSSWTCHRPCRKNIALGTEDRRRWTRNDHDQRPVTP